MKTCYVSAPFGEKKDQAGRTVDFDRIYETVLVPAVREAGLSCIRGDELEARGVILKTVFSAVLGSSVMIADISTHSPNVVYELGIRHALRREVTLIIMASGNVIPYHMNYNRIYIYELDENGLMSDAEADRLRSVLTSVIRSSLQRVTSDSPLYEFFPGLHVELPEEFLQEGSRTSYPRLSKRGGARRKAIPTRGETEDDARLIEQAVRETPNVDPHAHLEVLKKYRDASAWGELVRYADELPPEVANAPEVMQLLALALNRRGESGDQERAIALMEQLIAETGGDSESYGTLGRIYKDRYEEHKRDGRFEEAAEALDSAIRYYRQGFDKHPSDYYPGVNVVTLLLQRGGGPARAELEELLPRVRAAVSNKMQSSLVGYWELATALELACVAHEWDEAARLAERVADTQPAPWMIATTERNLNLIAEALDDLSDRGYVFGVISRLHEAAHGGEARNV